MRIVFFNYFRIISRKVNNQPQWNGREPGQYGCFFNHGIKYRMAKRELA